MQEFEANLIMEFSSDQELVKKCMQALCIKAGFENTNELVQRDIEFLCETIESKTGVLISISTVKRLIHGQFSRLPQIATLNAISRYIGFNNWHEFKLSQKNKANEESEQSGIKGDPVPSATWKVLIHRNRFAIYVALAIILTLALAFQLNISGVGNFDKAEFSYTKTTGNDIPNTIIFNYNVDLVKADSFFIQQSWDKNRRVQIYKNQYVLTDIYYEPGYHTAKLYANGQIIKSFGVSIPTDKWMFYAQEPGPNHIPKYISLNDSLTGKLFINKEHVLEKMVDVEKDQNYSMVYFPSHFVDTSDNFILKCRVKTIPVKNLACPFLMYEVFCQRYFTYFLSKPKGCAHEIMAQFGENELVGKTSDLSGLASDVLEYQDVEFKIENKRVSIKINNQETFNAVYENSSGLITGLGFISNGLPEVDSVSLKTLQGKIIYTNDFEISKPVQ